MQIAIKKSTKIIDILIILFLFENNVKTSLRERMRRGGREGKNGNRMEAYHEQCVRLRDLRVACDIKWRG